MKKILYISGLLLLPLNTWATEPLFVQNNEGCLRVEIMDDQLFRARFQEAPQCNVGERAFPRSPYVDRESTFKPPVNQYEKDDVVTLETGVMRVEVDKDDLCMLIHDKSGNREVTEICPEKGEKDWLKLEIDRDEVTQLYGLGQQHPALGVTDGDWMRHGKRFSGSEYGNQMVHTDGGLIGNTQFPILYVLGRTTPWFLFLDNSDPQFWNFNTSPMDIGVRTTDDVVFYIQLGDSLPELRRQYMELVGKPLVPSRKLFGLWVSEYGYDNWKEVDEIHQSLLKNGFPLDGFVMDLQWFGGIIENSEKSAMGKLTWDTKAFPNPEDKIKDLKENHIGLMLIEESYVNKKLKEHSTLAKKGYLVKNKDGSPVYLKDNPWWGKGGMIDWSNPQAGIFWHDWKRQPLVDMGILGHWTDLGEPMDFQAEGSVYHGFVRDKSSHKDIHNLYNLLWHRSIFEGYKRHQSPTRPFMLSRSGGPGMQRYGAGMWSGDIPANYGSLAAHLNVQMHMSLSGIDYFSSDAGGFYRESFPKEEGSYDDLYTRWYAISALIDIPLRPHADNICNCFHTSPDRVGHKASNLANTRMRYELIPYYYSLAHHAYNYGDPIIRPMSYVDERDFEMIGMGNQKMIGPGLMAVLETKPGVQSTRVYMPHGEWYDYRSNIKMEEQTRWLDPFTLYRNDLYQLPLFARAGAIIPIMDIPEKSVDAFGREQETQARPNSLVLKIYPGKKRTEFTHYDDDGETTAYQQGSVMKTRIIQQRFADHQLIEIEAVEGDYLGSPAVRNLQIQLAETTEIESISINGKEVKLTTEHIGTGWKRINVNTVGIYANALLTTENYSFIVKFKALTN